MSHEALTDQHAGAAADGSRRDPAASTPAYGRTDGLFGGVTPSEAARLRWQRERERKAQLTAETDFDSMTVQQRTAVALARTLTRSHLEEVIAATITAAKSGNTPAVKLTQEWIKLGAALAPDEPASGFDQKMTMAERSAIIARLLEEERGQRSPAGQAEDPRENTPAPR